MKKPTKKLTMNFSASLDDLENIGNLIDRVWSVAGNAPKDEYECIKKAKRSWDKVMQRNGMSYE